VGNSINHPECSLIFSDGREGTQKSYLEISSLGDEIISINGIKLTCLGKHKVSLGDYVKIGDCEFVFQQVDESKSVEVASMKEEPSGGRKRREQTRKCWGCKTVVTTRWHDCGFSGVKLCDHCDGDKKRRGEIIKDLSKAMEESVPSVPIPSVCVGCSDELKGFCELKWVERDTGFIYCAFCVTDKMRVTLEISQEETNDPAVVFAEVSVVVNIPVSPSSASTTVSCPLTLTETSSLSKRSRRGGGRKW
jgi:hypothetical protein